MDSAIFAISTISIMFFLIRNMIFAPSGDATEFAHAAWLITHGKFLYVDFFQNHSPWYIYLIVLIFNTQSAFFLLNLALFHASVALFSAAVFSRIIWHEAAAEDPTVRRRSALIAFLLFLTMYRAFTEQVMRPETLSVAALVTAFLCGRKMQAAGGLSRWMRAIGFALCIGLAVCLSPRATMLAMAAIVWIVWQNPGPRSWLRIAIALAGSATLLLAIISPFVSFGDVYRWVILFNGKLQINHHLNKFSIARGAHLYVSLYIATSFILINRVLSAILHENIRNHPNLMQYLQIMNKDRRLIYVELCMIISLIFLYFDRWWVIYSFDFVALVELFWLSIVGIYVSRTLSKGPKLTHMGMVFGLLALSLLWNIPIFLLQFHPSPGSAPGVQALYRTSALHPGDYLQSLIDIPRPEAEPISVALLEPSQERVASLAGWLRWSKRICMVAGGQTVLIFSSRPVCAPDPSYYWVRWAQLPMSDLAADMRKAKPVIIEKNCPPDLHCSMNPIEPPDDDYVDAGWAWIRPDLAQRLSVAPAG